jgi:hypothetical protein
MTSLALRLLVFVLGHVLLLGQSVPPSPGEGPAGHGYDERVLADGPVAFWTLSATARDAAPGRHDGEYRGGEPRQVTLPNGDPAARFDGISQYVEIPTARAFSVTTTGALTWEVWLRPDTLDFPGAGKGYVDFLGKCAEYSPSCEWEGRFYGVAAGPDRAGRISAYAFNPTAGLGSGDYWQGTPGTLRAGQWVHVVATYQTRATPAECDPDFPGTVTIWVNGVPQNFADHEPTGCLSQYRVRPEAGDSPVRIGTLAEDSWFPGGIGKVAVYDRVLPESVIAAHYRIMTGRDPTGHCEDLCTLSG